jgi:hypothetical protein
MTHGAHLTSCAWQAEFAGRRAAGMAPGMYIATPYDLHSSRW